MRAFAERPRTPSETAARHASLPDRARPLSNARFFHSRDEDSILHLQRTYGNRAVQRMLADSRQKNSADSGTAAIGAAATYDPAPTGNSLLPDPERGEFHTSTTSFSPQTSHSTHASSLAAGDQPEDTPGFALGGTPDAGVADAGPAADAGTTPDAGTASTPATSITTSDLSAADWQNNGFFKWWIKWVTDGKSGWIVQKIENTYSGTRADGTAITNASVGVTPTYYEAWEVASNGTITGSLGLTGNRDRWERPALGPLGSTLTFSMKGTVYWTATDPATSGFTSGGVTNAGSLLSSTSAPTGIGSPLLVRSAAGMYGSDGAPMLPGCFTS
jgi:hypothetical protein